MHRSMDLIDKNSIQRFTKHFLVENTGDDPDRDPILMENCIDIKGETVLANPINGQLYVIGNPSEILGGVATTTTTATPAGLKAISPRTHQVEIQAAPQPQQTFFTNATPTEHITMKDIKQGTRRATHNEVERRRRDNINNWIEKLGTLIPEGGQESVGNGKSSLSKGGILAKACEYLVDLRNSRSDSAVTKDRDKALEENKLLQLELKKLKRENALLRQQLKSNNLIDPLSTGSVSTLTMDSDPGLTLGSGSATSLSLGPVSATPLSLGSAAATTLSLGNASVAATTLSLGSAGSAASILSLGSSGSGPASLSLSPVTTAAVQPVVSRVAGGTPLQLQTNGSGNSSTTTIIIGPGGTVSRASTMVSEEFANDDPSPPSPTFILS